MKRFTATAFISTVLSLSLPLSANEQGQADEATLGAEDNSSVPGGRLAVLIGVHDWSGLGELQSTGGGGFQSTGANFAAAGHKRVTDLQWSTLLLGGEIGFFTNDSNIRGLTADLSARGMYLMPSMKLAVGRQRTFYLDAGAGLYIVDFVEYDCGSFACTEMDDIWQEEKLGGYLGFSADIHVTDRWAVALEAKAHFVSFGSVSALGPESQELDGPIYMLQVGAAF